MKTYICFQDLNYYVYLLMKTTLTSLLLVLILFTACQQPRSFDSPTYLGGQIMNPKTDYVLFSENEEILDTLWLDQKGRFIKTIPVFEDGLYTFKHGNEYQYIFLQPSDSLIFRLNTWDFDESLVFSGIGSARNEYLIDLFIQNEKEDAQLRALFNLPPEDLKEEIEGVRQRKQRDLNDFLLESEEQNNLYIRYARAAIDYPLYRKMEIYPLALRNYLRSEKIPEVPVDFYDYRKNIDLNDPVLANFYSHRNYVLSYLYHLAYEKTIDNKDKGINTYLIEYVNDSINELNLKESLLTSAIYEEFFTGATLNLNQEVTTAFFKTSTNKELNDKVSNLIADSQKIANGSKLKDFEVLNQKLKPYSINALIKNRNTVIYFWSEQEIEAIKLAGKINYLQKKYPMLLFIGINLDYNEDNPLNIISLKYINEQNQFALPSHSIANTYNTSGYTRTLLVNRYGYVIDNFANISSRYFEKSLKFLEKN